MLRLTPKTEPSPRRPGIHGGASVPWLLIIQLAILASFLVMMLRDPAAKVETGAHGTTRVRYTISRAEWPVRPPTLRQIHDRYVGDLPAMRIANQPGSCADPNLPIDYGDVVFIEFSSDGERCIEEQTNQTFDE